MMVNVITFQMNCKLVNSTTMLRFSRIRLNFLSFNIETGTKNGFNVKIETKTRMIIVLVLIPRIEVQT